jgi:hypothetical protein
VASTQIEIALAEDDRKRIDRLCNVIERKHAIDEFEGWLQKRYAALVFTHNGRGKRPATMPPKRSDGREFDGGPNFGNGSWAQLDEDGVWRRYGG